MLGTRKSISTKPLRRAGKELHIGYVRVSAVDQNELRELDGIELDKTFTDKASGKDINRPQLELLLSFVRSRERYAGPVIPWTGSAATSTISESLRWT